MSQDALTKLAMELAEWPSDGREKVTPQGRVNEKMWLQRRAELINKPSWDDAPKWAEWLAQDADGQWNWFDEEPYMDLKEWCIAYQEMVGKARRGALVAGLDWRQTLERRPAESRESGVIYAIHRKTKEHRIVKSNSDVCEKEWYLSQGWRLVQAEADGWIPREGGECPLPYESQCKYKVREGAVKSSTGVVAHLEWKHSGSFSDVIAYCPILDESSEREAENRTPESAAVATLERLGYRYCGGMEWKPPLGPPRRFEADGDYFVFSEPEAVEWDGEGNRPPAGSICMLRNRLADGVSCPAYIEYMSEQSCVWSWRDDGLERTMHANPSALEFRPIRSEEGRSIDEMIMAAGLDDNGYNREVCRDLYLAGCRMMGGKR